MTAATENSICEAPCPHAHVKNKTKNCVGLLKFLSVIVSEKNMETYFVAGKMLQVQLL